MIITKKPLLKDRMMSFRIPSDIVVYTDVCNRIKNLIDDTTAQYCEKHNIPIKQKSREILNGSLPSFRQDRT